jgi:hypothetical protein
MLFHHDPGRSDDALELHRERAQALAEPDELAVGLAREGMVLELS